MCLAVPVQIVEILDHDQAIADMGGVRKSISTALLDEVAVGDYVIVHVGYAIGSLDPEEAEHTLALLREAGLMPGTGSSADESGAPGRDDEVAGR